MKKNDLSKFAGGHTNQLEAAEKARSRRPGPTPKDPKAKASYKVGLSFTPAQEKKIKEKAGMVPIATFIVSVLEEKGLI